MQILGFMLPSRMNFYGLSFSRFKKCHLGGLRSLQVGFCRLDFYRQGIARKWGREDCWADMEEGTLSFEQYIGTIIGPSLPKGKLVFSSSFFSKWEYRFLGIDNSYGLQYFESFKDFRLQLKTEHLQYN